MKLYVATGDIREVVQVDDGDKATEQALIQLSERGGVVGTPGKYVAVSPTGFFHEDSLWEPFDDARKRAGIVFADEVEGGACG